MKKVINFLYLKLALIIIIIFAFNLSYAQTTAVTVDFNTTGLSPGTVIAVPVRFNSTATIGGFCVMLYYNMEVLTYNTGSVVLNSAYSGLGIYKPGVNTPYLIPSGGLPQYTGKYVTKVSFPNTGNATQVPYNSNDIAFTLYFTYHGGNTNLLVINQNGSNSAYNSFIKNGTSVNTNTTWADGALSGSLATITSNTGGGNWTSSTTWDLGHRPNTSNGSVIINSIPATPVTMNIDTTVTGDLTINSGGALSITSGKTLTVSGNLLIKSDATSTGSLIHNASNLSVAGTTTVQRYLPSWLVNTYTTGWHQISSPVDGNALDNFISNPTTDYDFYKWSEPNVQWLNQKTVGNNITSFSKGVGYMVSYLTAGTHDFSGSITTDNVSPTITYSVQSPVNTTGQGWNLIGNPYTSALNVADITSWALTNVNPYVAVYDDFNSNYKYWNGTTGNLTNNVVPTMQAFWVKANAASPAITIPYGNRVHNAQNLYKSSSVADIIRLTVTSENGYSDEAFVYFSSSATNGLDEATDVPKLASPSQVVPQLYSLIGTDKYAINAMGELTSVSVPIGFQPGVNGTFTIKANELSSFVNGTIIDLQDLKTGTYQKLMQNDTYTFTANTTDDVNRFVLHFNKAQLSVDENKAVSTNIFSYGNDIFVNSTESSKQIAIYNTIGQLIYSVDNHAAGMFKYSLNGNAGYYIVRVITDKNVSSEKVFVK